MNGRAAHGAMSVGHETHCRAGLQAKPRQAFRRACRTDAFTCGRADGPSAAAASACLSRRLQKHELHSTSAAKSCTPPDAHPVSIRRQQPHRASVRLRGECAGVHAAGQGEPRSQVQRSALRGPLLLQQSGTYSCLKGSRAHELSAAHRLAHTLQHRNTRSHRKAALLANPAQQDEMCSVKER